MSKRWSAFSEASQSGGIVLVATIHDIDLALSFFGNAKPTAIRAAGVRAYHKDIAAERGADNVVGLCEFHDKVAHFLQPEDVSQQLWPLDREHWDQR